MNQSAILAPRHPRFQSIFSDSSHQLYPLWMMRQAGRYLPEYKALKAEHQSFITLCKTPELCKEVTLQPLRRFELDAAIIFSDILFILELFQIKLDFIPSGGPVFDCSKFTSKPIKDVTTTFNFLKEALQAVALELHPYQTLIGFVGGPWTVGLYAWQQTAGKGFEKALSYIKQDPQDAYLFLEQLAISSAELLSLQVQAGANYVMIFESWAQICPPQDRQLNVWGPAQRTIELFKLQHPTIPVGYYARGSLNLEMAGVDVFGIDDSYDLSSLQKNYSGRKNIFQGNISPEWLLIEEAPKLKKKIQHFLDGLAYPVVVNLGHGILPETPLENVSCFIETVREFEQLLMKK